MFIRRRVPPVDSPVLVQPRDYSPEVRCADNATGGCCVAAERVGGGPKERPAHPHERERELYSKKCN